MKPVTGAHPESRAAAICSRKPDEEENRHGGERDETAASSFSGAAPPETAEGLATLRSGLWRRFNRLAAAIASSLKLKFIVIITLLLACTVGVAPWWAIKMHERQLLDVSAERLHSLYGMLRESIVATCVLTGDPDAVQQVFEQLRGYHNLDLVRLFDEKGHILYSSMPDERGRTLPRAEMARYYGHPTALVATEPDGTATHSLVRPVFVEPSCTGCHGTGKKILGVIQVSLSLGEAESQLKMLRHWAMLATLVSLIVITIGIWTSLTALIDRPLQQLVGTMGRAARGDLSVRAKLGRADELGKLGEHLNDMIMKLEAARKEVAHYHRQQLLRADRLATIGEMAAAVAHEIRNPLTGISGILTVLSADLPDDDLRREGMRKIHALIDRLNTSVEKILDYSRPAPPQRRFIPLKGVIDMTVGLVEAEAKKASVRIVREPCKHPTCGEAPAAIRVDAHQMQQVLMNLILNAIQATSRRGTVWARTCTRTDPDGRKFGCISIEDTGCGMTPEAVEQAFQPFFSTKTQGTGLGLPIAKQIVEQHGGRISIESAPGQGTCVSVEIPLEPDPSEPPNDHGLQHEEAPRPKENFV